MGRPLNKVEYSQRIDGKWNKWQTWSAADWYDWDFGAFAGTYGLHEVDSC